MWSTAECTQRSAKWIDLLRLLCYAEKERLHRAALQQAARDPCRSETLTGAGEILYRHFEAIRKSFRSCAIFAFDLFTKKKLYFFDFFTK